MSKWFAFRRPFFSKPQINPVEDREAVVRTDLARYFNDYEFWFAQLHNQVFQVLETYGAHPEIQQPVANLETLLLARLVADLRNCQRAACDGYPLQAMTVASSAREVAFGIIYIGGSDERAREWIAHSKESETYPQSHKSAIESAKAVLAFTDDDVKRERRVYTELCWGKHGNPILQRNYGALDMASFVEVQQQPYVSELTVRFGRYALLHACRAVIYATRAFLKLHLSAVGDTKWLDAIEEQLNMLGVRDKLVTS